MPDSWRDELDTPASFDSVGSFEGGQVSYAKPRLLQPNQSALIQDGEIAITGQVSTRFGTNYLGSTVSASKITGLFYMNTTTVSQEVMIDSNGLIWKLVGNTWTSTTVSISISDIPSIVQGANVLYLAGGDQTRQWDGTTFTQIDGDGSTQGPRSASILVWFTNRLIAAGPSIKSVAAGPVVSDAIYFSNLLDATNWGSPKGSQQIRVGAGDGIAITALVPWTQFNLAVFKRRSVWVVNADPSLAVADMPIQLVHGTVGCVAKKSAVQVGADILFLSDDGIRSLSRTFASDQNEQLSVPLSYPVQDYIQRINWSAASNACAIFWRNLYIISLPLDTSSTNNFILVYNTLTNSWQGVWTNLPVNVFAVRLVSGLPRLMAGLATADRVIEYNDYVPQANWVNTASTFATNTITISGTPANLDTVTVNGQLYTFRTALSGGTNPNEVHINGQDGSLANLASAINDSGVEGTDYGNTTIHHPDVSASAVVSHTITLTARSAGALGNAMTMSKSSSVINLGGAFTGGSTGTFSDYDASQVQLRVKTKSFMFNDPIALKIGNGGEIEWNNSDGILSVSPVLDELAKTGPNVDVSSGGFTPPITPPFTIAPSGLARARFDLIQYGEFRELQFDIQGLSGGRKELRQLSAAGFIRPSLVGNS